MGKKKRGHPDVEEILSRPWCYYCERDFDDLKILINHQKAKHFKCERCGRRLNTAGGLNVHMTQVHKETLTTIENALPNRSNLDVEIFGMEGIPGDVVQSHQQRVLSQFAQAEAERRAATGNTGPNGAGAGGVKKPKFESPSDLKKRLAEHKAKMAAEKAAGISSGDATPLSAGQGNQSPALIQSFPTGSPPYVQQQMPYGGPPNNASFAPYPSSYGQPGVPYQQPQTFPMQSPGFSSPNGPHFPGNQAFAPPQQYSPPINQNFMPPYQNGPPRPYGAVSPPMPYHPQGQYQPPRTHTPPQNGLPPQRTGSLPPAPGLPQRPSFGAPPVNAFQMQQMHQGQIPGPPNPASTSYSNQQGNITQNGRDLDASQNGRGIEPSQLSNGTSMSPLPGQTPDQESVGVPSTNPRLPHEPAAEGAHKTDKVASTAEPPPEPETKAPEVERKGKKDKDKDKNTRLVYSDNETSPEEKMAKLPRYAFVPDGEEGVVLGDATTAAVAGTVDLSFNE